MTKFVTLLATILLLTLTIGALGCSDPDVTPTSTPVPTPAETPTTQPPPQSTPSANQTATPTATPIPDITPTPAPTSTATPTATPPPAASFPDVLLYNLSAPRHSTALAALEEKGYSVQPLEGYGALDAGIPEQYGILIVRIASLSPDEVPVVMDWVEAGGGALFLVEKGLTPVTIANSVLTPLCEIQVNDDNVGDPEHRFPYGLQEAISATPAGEHPTTRNVSELGFLTTDGLQSLTVAAGGAQVIVAGGQSAYSIVHPSNPPLVVAAESGQGRVVAASGVQTFSDSFVGYGDNLLFLENIASWLARST